MKQWETATIHIEMYESNPIHQLIMILSDIRYSVREQLSTKIEGNYANLPNAPDYVGKNMRRIDRKQLCPILSK